MSSETGQARATRRGFTLIELLVVVAVIALLIGLLVPALGKARGIAKTVVCLSNQRQLSLAVTQYALDNDQYIPGPNTSGLGPDPSRITSFDWMTQVLPDRFGSIRADSDGVSRDFDEVVRRVLNDEFRCPSNEAIYDLRASGSYYPGNDRTDDLFQASYSAASSMHFLDNPYAPGMPGTLRPKAIARQAAVQAAASRAGGGGPRLFNTSGSTNDNQAAVSASGHKFRMDTLGPPSMKVWLQEGSRYIDYVGGRYSIQWADASSRGDVFINRGPGMGAWQAGNGSPYRYRPGTSRSLSGTKVLDPIASQFSYRHSDEGMSLSFFDGHAEVLEEKESRSAKYWWPSGSLFLQINNVSDPSIKVGDVVP